MILATKTGGNKEVFAAFDSSTPIPRPSQVGGSLSWSGRHVGLTDAVGLPAFMRAIRLLFETAAGFPIKVYRGYDDERTPEAKAPQLGLLRRPAGGDMPAYSVWAYTFASMLGGNAYLWKVKTRTGLQSLYPVDPRIVTPKYEDAELTFEIRDRPTGSVQKVVGRESILHIPGILLEHPCIGVSLVQAFRNGLGTQLSRQEFEARYLANDGFPGVVLKHPQNQTKDVRDAIREGFEARHAGPGNAGRPAILWGGWEMDRLAVTLDEAQFVETAAFSVRDIGRMTGVPSGMLNDPEAPSSDSPEQENMRFLQYGLDPWLCRAEQAIASDPDLFPEPDWSVDFDPSRLLKADIKTRFEAYRLARQGGWITPNEIRAEEGREAVEGGDEIQITPVGGAPNEGTSTPA